MRITNTQKKELFTLFSKNGLNLLDFETSGLHKEFKVKFKYEYYSFYINFQKADVYTATIFPVNNTLGYSESGTWQQIKSKFDVWTQHVATELSTPTGWESFQSDNFLNAELSELDKDFSETEKLVARQSIKELIDKIKTIELPENTFKIIENKLDQLSVKIDDLKKFDWKSLFLGTFASLIMTLSIPPEASGLIWEYIKNSFFGLKLKS